MDRFAFLNCLPYLHECSEQHWDSLQKLSDSKELRANARNIDLSKVGVPLLGDSNHPFDVSVEPTINNNGKYRGIGPIGFSPVISHKLEIGGNEIESTKVKLLDPCLCRFEAILANVDPSDSALMSLFPISSPSGSSTTTTTHVSGSQSNSSPLVRRDLLATLEGATPITSTPMARTSFRSSRQHLQMTPIHSSAPHLYLRFDEKFVAYLDCSQILDVTLEEANRERPQCIVILFEGCSFRIFPSVYKSTTEIRDVNRSSVRTTLSNKDSDGPPSLSIVKYLFTQFLVGNRCDIPPIVKAEYETKVGHGTGESDPSSHHEPGQRQDCDLGEGSLNDEEDLGAETQVQGAASLSKELRIRQDQTGDEDGSEDNDVRRLVAVDNYDEDDGDRTEFFSSAISKNLPNEETIEATASEQLVDCAERILQTCGTKRKMDDGWMAIETFMSSKSNASFKEIEACFLQARIDDSLQQKQFQRDLNSCDSIRDRLESELHQNLETLFPGPRSRSPGRSLRNSLKLNATASTQETFLTLLQKHKVAVATRHLIAINAQSKFSNS